MHAATTPQEKDSMLVLFWCESIKSVLTNADTYSAVCLMLPSLPLICGECPRHCDLLHLGYCAPTLLKAEESDQQVRPFTDYL
jgi:hypothetical protein